MHEWLANARSRLVASVGEDATGYDLTQADAEALLELARVAAHESGERTNAPLVSYLVGLAHGRHPDRMLDELIEHATGSPPGQRRPPSA